MIKKENFQKLKQLDRIEFRQRHSYLRDKYRGSLFFIFLTILCIILGFVLLIAISGYAAVGLDFCILMLNFFNIIFRIGGTIVIFGIVIDFLKRLIYLKKLKELEGEYFKTEIK